MISFPQAFALTLQHAPRMGVERCAIENASGRVLRSAVVADRDFPPYDRVMMDGFALRWSAIQAGVRKFLIGNSAPAGHAQVALPEAFDGCSEVMTGAVLPAGAECIVPVEWTRRVGDTVFLLDEKSLIEQGRFIHRCGSDRQQGEEILLPGMLLGSREMGVAASCGAHQLDVSRQPCIAVIPTGDELVVVDTIPQPHQIRQSNGYAIAAALQRDGYACEVIQPWRDTGEREKWWDDLSKYDWLIFTGAVSMGRHDFLPRWLEEMSCEKIFHGVAQRPGKPMGFWRGAEGQAILALPGNPVSALTGLHTLALPALAVGSCRLPCPKRWVTAAEPFPGIPKMTQHLPVKVDADGRAHPAPCGNSGDFIGLLRSDGFVSISPDEPNQSAYVFTPWR